MNINDLTIGEAKELVSIFGGTENNKTLNAHVGEKVIIRTYSAGAWFGLLSEKSGSEVILNNARRLWRWQSKKSISLSAVAIYGIDKSKSKICAAVDKQWLEAIEIISMSSAAIKSIEGAENVEAV